VVNYNSDSNSFATYLIVKLLNIATTLVIATRLKFPLQLQYFQLEQVNIKNPSITTILAARDCKLGLPTFHDDAVGIKARDGCRRCNGGHKGMRLLAGIGTRRRKATTRSI
jgi:hypothetical protein